jgi:hypothetical protein
MSPADAMAPADTCADDWGDEKTRVDEVAALVLRVDGGGEEGPWLRFVHGEAREPLTVGRAGQLRIDGPGVLEVHAFVHFDGIGLFVCSTDAAHPVRLDGRALPRSWTALEPGSRLQMGEVTLVVRFALAPAKREGDAAPRPQASVSPLEDDDVTRAAPPLVVLRTDGGPEVSPTAPQVPPPDLTTSPGAGRLRAQRRSARRVFAVASVAALGTWVAVAAVILALRHGRAPGRIPASATPSPQPASQVPIEPAITGAVVHPAPPRPPVAQSGARPGTPSMERLAADAMQSGDLQRALSLYEQLAREQPDNPALARAADILRQRVASGPRSETDAPRR